MDSQNSARGSDAPSLFDSAPEPSRQPDEPQTLALQLHELGRLRRIYVESRMFENPAWNIMLSLYIGHGKGYPVSLASLCAANQLQPPECETHVGALVERGFVSRESRATGSELVALSERGLQRMDSFLQSALRR